MARIKKNPHKFLEFTGNFVPYIVVEDLFKHNAKISNKCSQKGVQRSEFRLLIELSLCARLIREYG